MPLEDHVTTISGERLKTRTYGKTFGDYIQTARNWGFEISRIEEARVNPEHLKGSPAFFDSVNGVPLDLVVELRKPLESDTMSASKSLGILPKKLNWNSGITRHPEMHSFSKFPTKSCKSCIRLRLNASIVALMWMM
jgi:hypothetical protein